MTLLDILEESRSPRESRGRPQWRTIRGGSRTYVNAIASRFAGQIRLSSPILGVERSAVGTVMVWTDSGMEEFDAVVTGCAQRPGTCNVEKTDGRRAIDARCHQVSTEPRHAAHGHDPALTCAQGVGGVETTTAAGLIRRKRRSPYDMTALQHLPGSRRYLVSLEQ